MMPSSNRKSPPESFDAHFVAAFRCVLAAVVLLVLSMDPEAHLSFPGMAHLVLSFYLIYSILLYAAAHWWRSTWSITSEPWFDVGWAVTLTVLSSEPRDMLAGFLFFAILVTAFQWGMPPGFRLGRVMAILVLSFGMALGYSDGEAGVRYTLMGAAAMGMWGYLAASFSRQELGHKRRIALLKNVSQLSNLRFGIDHTLGMIAQQLRTFYDADACLLITRDPCRIEYQLRRAERQSPDRAVRAEVLPMALTHLLLAWPEQDAVIFSGRHWFWQRCFPKASAETIVLSRGTWRVSDERHGQTVPAMLDTMAFITMPFSSPDLRGGRLYMTAGRRRAFDPTDVDFLQLVFDHLRPVLQNLTLAAQVASDAAEAERRRIALDVPDGVIQPYIGLQMGLGAVRHKLHMGSTDVTHDIDCLLHLTHDELVQLRHMVQDLKHGGEGFDGLVPAIRRFGVKFSAASGIQVQVQVNGELSINDDLAAEVFHILAEGLSNIRRHTQATTARISLVQEHEYLHVEIRNDGVEGEDFKLFTPRSITERTMALGGEVRIERQSPAQTAVIAEIPL